MNPLDIQKITREQLEPIAEDKAKEIVDMFLPVFTELDSSVAEKLAVKCALVHIKPFRSPLDIPAEMKEKLNGAGLERLQMIVDFWDEVQSKLEKKLS